MAGQKPFSNFSTPSSISPYANMFRVRSASGVDNYNLYVRPLLEQQTVNQQTQATLENVGEATRQQGSAIRGLQQQAQGVPGGGRSGGQFMNYGQYFMNYQGYYPGGRR